MLNEYFDQIYLINLDDRPDRLEFANKELSKFNIKYKRISGEKVDFNQIDPLKYSGYEKQTKRYVAGQYGCKLAHIKCVLNGRKNHYQNILILEDDIEISPNANEIFACAIQNLTNLNLKWDMLYLGGRYAYGGFYTNGKKWFQEYVGKHLLKLKGAMLGTAYAVKPNVQEYILKNCLNEPYEIDIFYYRMLQKNIFNTYGLLPPIFKQTNVKSDIK